MDLIRVFAAVALLAAPTVVVAQESAGEFATLPSSASVAAHSVPLPADRQSGGAKLRIAIPAGTFEVRPAQGPNQSTSPGRWQSVDAWPSGERMIVTLVRGDVVDGVFKDATADDLLLTSPTGNDRRIPKVEVRQVKGVKKDTAVDGLLLGAAVGAGVGALIGYNRRTFECASGCSVAIGTTLFTPVGALAGWVRDRRNTHIEILYNAP